MKKYKPVNLRKKKSNAVRNFLAVIGLVSITWFCSGEDVAGQRIEKVEPLRVVDIIERAEREMQQEVKPVELFKPASHVKLRKAKKPVDEQELRAMTLLLYGTEEEAKRAEKILSSNLK